MMHRGYIKYRRSSVDNELYFAEKFTRRQAWQDLILTTNHKDGQIIVRGNYIEIKRGQNGYSEETFAKRRKWSRNKVRRFLKHLETEHQIEQQKSKLKTVITIINREKYQGNGTTDETTERHQTKQQTDTNKNDKNDKNGKEDILPPKKSELHVEDVVDYIRKFIEKKSSEYQQVSSQIKKVGLDAYLVQGEEARHKLIKMGYADAQIKLALEGAIGDEFRKKQIRTPRKLLERNPEGVLYMDVMLDVAKALLAKKNKDAMK